MFLIFFTGFSILQKLQTEFCSIADRILLTKAANKYILTYIISKRYSTEIVIFNHLHSNTNISTNHKIAENKELLGAIQQLRGQNFAIY